MSPSAIFQDRRGLRGSPVVRVTRTALASDAPGAPVPGGTDSCKRVRAAPGAAWAKSARKTRTACPGRAAARRASARLGRPAGGRGARPDPAADVPPAALSAPDQPHRLHPPPAGSDCPLTFSGCRNNITDAGETGLNCGGGVCPDCCFGQGCILDTGTLGAAAASDWQCPTATARPQQQLAKASGGWVAAPRLARCQYPQIVVCCRLPERALQQPEVCGRRRLPAPAAASADGHRPDARRLVQLDVQRGARQQPLRGRSEALPRPGQGAHG